MPFEIYHRTEDDKDFLPETPEMRQKAEDAASNWTGILLDVEPVAEKISGKGINARYSFTRADLYAGIRDAILEALTSPY